MTTTISTVCDVCGSDITKALKIELVQRHGNAQTHEKHFCSWIHLKKFMEKLPDTDNDSELTHERP